MIVPRGQPKKGQASGRAISVGSPRASRTSRRRSKQTACVNISEFSEERGPRTAEVAEQRTRDTKSMDQITPGMTYGLALLAVGAYSIPLLLIGWLWFRTPIRRTWVSLLFFLGLMAIIHVASELVGTDGITALIYILSGAAK